MALKGLGLMNADRLIDSLTRFAKVLPPLVEGTSAEDARWRPPSGNWSILEVLCHLVDEEVEDFRTRVRLTISDPSQPWPAIDPEAAANLRRYNDADLQETTQRFVQERNKSIEFLRGLSNPDWSQIHQHPRFGPISAGEVLAAWASHDYLHVRQIAKRLFEMVGRDAVPYPTRYAGDWSD